MRRAALILVTAGGLALAVVLGLASAARATPADPAPRTLTQPDGTTFTARLFGDEYVNGWETVAGYTVVPGADGAWTFARQLPSGRLEATGIRPEGDGRPPASAELVPHVRDEVAQAAAEGARPEGFGGGGGTPPVGGPHPVLVVLVEFEDQPLTTTPADWAELFFGADQSVADFYADASYGANGFELVPARETDTTDGGAVDDGVVVVQLNRDHPNSGKNFGPFLGVARQAVQATEELVDYTSFDAEANGGNEDGRLSPDELHLALVVAGTEAAQGCAGPSVWGHRTTLPSLPGELVLDGVVVGHGDDNGGYFAAGELQRGDPLGGDPACNAQATLGIWVHELGHDFGLLDLYDTDGSSAGIDTWSVMARHWLALDGERNGSRPPLPDPFSRSQVGWLTPTQITEATDDVALAASASHADAIQVGDNPDEVDIGFLGGGGTGEYFLVENRHPEGYDVAIAGCGVLVWHIDESAFGNRVDDARLVDLEEAGGGDTHTGTADADDPFPQPGHATFGPNTSPDSGVNSGMPTGTLLSDFSGCGPTATLDVDPAGPIPRPRNDRFGNAPRIRLFDGEGRAQRSVRFHNVRATHQPPERPHDGTRGRSSIWWSFRPPRAGFVNLTTISSFRDVVAVYTGRHVGVARRVEAVRGAPPGGAVGSPPAASGQEDVRRGLTFRVERHVVYHVAVDSVQPGRTGGVRLFLDYTQVRPDARPAQRWAAPHRRPLIKVALRNTSRVEAVRVTRLLEGTRALHAVDCPGSFVIQPGRTRTCHVRSFVTGPAGTRLRGKVWARAQWLGSGQQSSVADIWFLRVRRR